MQRALHRLNEVIDSRAVTTVAIAEGTGLDQGNISRVLNGVSPQVSFVTVALIAKYLDISLDWLVNEPPPPARIARPTPVPESGTLQSSRPPRG